jgi:hypothetical protein
MAAIRVIKKIRQMLDFAGSLTDGYVISYDSNTDKFKLIEQTGGITSINGQTGPTVVLTTSDISGLDTSINSKLDKSANLSDITDASTARINLGLGTASIQPSSAFATAIHSHAQSDITGLSSALATKASLDSPDFINIPTAPTATAGTNTTQIATTAFVRTEISALINSAPDTLDTLGEIATQLANDESVVTALTTTVAGKLSKSSNLSDLIDISIARTNLGLGTIATHDIGDFATASDLAAHEADITNPHGTTAAQVGAYTTTEVDTALGLKVDTTTYNTFRNGISTLGTIASQNSNSVSITGGSGAFTTLTLGGTTVSIVGHTHTLSNITDAGTMASQNASNVTITGGTVTVTTVKADTLRNTDGTFIVNATGDATVAGTFTASGGMTSGGFSVSAVSGTPTITKSGIGTTSTDGLLLTNTTTGSVQYSPLLRLHGNGRNTTGAGSDVSCDLTVQVQPAFGTVDSLARGSWLMTYAGTTILSFNSNINTFTLNNSALSVPGGVSTAGGLTFTKNDFSSVLSVNANNSITCNNYLSTGSDRGIVLTTGNMTNRANVVVSNTTTSVRTSAPVVFSILPNIQQTGTQTNSIIYVSAFYDADNTTTGTQYLINLGTHSQSNGDNGGSPAGGGTHTSKFTVDKSGNGTLAGTFACIGKITAPNLDFERALVIPAGVTVSAGVKQVQIPIDIDCQVVSWQISSKTAQTTGNFSAYKSTDLVTFIDMTATGTKPSLTSAQVNSANCDWQSVTLSTDQFLLFAADSGFTASDDVIIKVRLRRI